MRDLVSPHLSQNSVLLLFLILAIILGMWWYLLWSQIAFPPWLVMLGILPRVYLPSVYPLQRSVLPGLCPFLIDTWFANISSRSVAYLNRVLQRTKFSVCRSLIYLSFTYYTVGVMSKNSSRSFRSQNVLLCFLLKVLQFHMDIYM